MEFENGRDRSAVCVARRGAWPGTGAWGSTVRARRAARRWGPRGTTPTRTRES